MSVVATEVKPLYIVFEGIEGSGKTTLIKAVSKLLKDRDVCHISTKHPGSTPLGAHLRTLTKYPEQIDPKITMDNMSTQLLMVADAINFYRTVLEPNLREAVTVLADRCNPISMLAYGLADGLTHMEVHRLLSIMKPPRPDRLYILRCDPLVAYERMRAQNGGDGIGLDRFERKGTDFMRRLSLIYNSLGTHTGPDDSDCDLWALVSQVVAFENVRYLDATSKPAVLAEQVFNDLQAIMNY